MPWRPSLGEAREEAGRSGKLVFISLWHHHCGGSKTMGERTYPDETARSYLEQYFVPVCFNIIEEPETRADFDSGWTPTLIVEDAESREYRSSQGYLDGAYARKLMDAGVHVSLSRFPGTMHEFFGMTRVIDSSRLAVRQAALALSAAFEGLEPKVSGR